MEKNNVRETYRHKLLKWTGTIFTLIGVWTMSISPTMAAGSVPLFGLFLIAHLSWGTYGWLTREKSLIWMNAGMLPLDVYAMWIRI